MSTNSLQLNCNSQILTDEDVHFKLADRDKAQSSGEKTSFQYSSRFFFLSSCGWYKQVRTRGVTVLLKGCPRLWGQGAARWLIAPCEVRVMYQSRAAAALRLKGWVGFIEKYPRKKVWFGCFNRSGGTLRRLSVCLSAVNNKCGRKKYIYYDKDRHQATQTWGGGWFLEGSGMENADGNCFSKSKLYIEDGTEVVKNNRKHCWIPVSLSIQG